MTNNTIQAIERMQASFPHIYNVYDKGTILYALLSVFGEKYGMRTDIVDRLYAMIGIDSTYDEDLEYRWGSLLNIYKQFGESYDEYRSRLKIVYSSLSGGTAESIKYAIASAAGINSNIDNYVHVYDAWKYPYYIDTSLLGIDEIVDETSLYGSIICTVDLAGIDNIIDHTKIASAINQTKASGINPYLLFLYNIEESLSLPRNRDRLIDTIKQDIHESAKFNNIDGSVLGEAILGKTILGDITNSVDNVVDNIIQTTQETASIDTFNSRCIDTVIPRTIQESATISSDVNHSSKIMQEVHESVLVDSNDNLQYSDIKMQTTQEIGMISDASNIWGNLGTNSAILNESFVTNIYAEPDECVDVITYSAELGTGILGNMILNVTM